MLTDFRDKFSKDTILKILIVAGVYFVLARLSLLLAFENSNVSPVWPPAGFAFAIMLIWGYRIGPGIFLGALAANVVVFFINHTCPLPTAFWTSAVIAVGNTLEAAAGTFLLRKFVPSLKKQNLFSSSGSIFWFLYTSIVMCLVGCGIGATTLLLAGIITSTQYFTIAFTWWTGDASGVLLITPLIFTWWIKPLKDSFVVMTKSALRFELIAIFLTVLFTSGIVFDDWFWTHQIFRWAFWVIPAIVWAAVRLEQHVSMATIFLCAIIAVWGTLNLHGPFADLTTNEALISVEGFISVIVMTTLLLNSTVRELRDTETELRTAHSELETRINQRTAVLREQKEFIETLFDSVVDPIAVLDKRGYYIAVNKKSEKMFEPLQLLGKNVLELFPDAKETGMYNNFLKALNGEIIHDLNYHSSRLDRYMENYYIPLKNDMQEVTSVLIIAHDITRVRQSEERTKRSEEKFIKLFNSSPFGITLTEISTGKFIEANDNFLEMMGYSRHEVIGHNSLEFDMVDPEERNKVMLEIQRKGAIKNLEIEVKKKSGEKIWVMQSTEIISVGEEHFFLNAFNEISNRKRAEEQLKESEERIQSIFRSAPDAVIVMDATGKIVGWNPQAEVIFGWKAKEIIGKNLRDTIIPERMHNELLHYFETDSGAAIKTIESPALRKSGKEFFVSLSISVTMIKGRKHFTAFVSDITEYRQAQETLRQKSIELERSNLELEHFAYAASHDLQEPLRSVIAYLQIIEKRYKDKLDDDAIEFIHRSVDSAVRMRTLINDLLSYSRVRTMDIEFKKVDSQYVADVALDNLHRLMEENKGHVVFETPMPAVTGSDLQLTLLFQNLISNGIKYKNEKPPVVTIAAEEKDAYWQFSVKDNGMGIRKEDYERIFRIFQRLHTRDEFPGTGIGLALCKKIVERHGGNIWVQSEPGKGSTFYFTIPKKQVAEEVA
jgi:PAS domain S-box-containing protein